MKKSVFSIVCMVVIIIHPVAFAGDNAAQASRIAVHAELLNLAARAQQYYWLPWSKGGGGGSFVSLTADAAGLVKLTLNSTNHNGTFYILTSGNSTSVELAGMGSEKGDDGLWIKVRMLIFADSVYATFYN